MAGFGMDTDIFGLADTNLRFVSSKATPRPKQVAEARDEDGNIAAETKYGTITIIESECVYALKGGSLDLSTLALGPSDTGGTKCISGIDGSTSNSDWPTLTVKGVTGCVGLGTTPTFTLPAITITGARKAQAIGFTLGANCKLTGSGFSASGEVSEVLDSAANVGAMAFSGAKFEANGDAVEISAAVSVTWDTTHGIEAVQGAGADKSNTAYGTTSFSGEIFIAADT